MGVENLAASLSGRSPESTPEPHLGSGWKLTDLIDVRTLQSIQDTFARAFQLPTVILHADGSNATDITHRVRFCEDLTRASAIGGPRCATCDRDAMRTAAQTGAPAIFRCWNGLNDCAIPIVSKGETLGYFLCGQVLMDEPDTATFRMTAGELGVDPDVYIKALQEVGHADYERYQASVQSMQVLAELIAEQATASIDNLTMLEAAEEARADASRLLDELEGIIQGLLDVGSHADYHGMLRAVGENLARLIPSDSCVIYLTDIEHRELVPVVVRDPYAAQVERFRPQLGRSVVGKVALTGVGVRLSEVTQQPEFEPIPGVPIEAEAVLVVPMVSKDVVSGVIVLSRLGGQTFSDHEFRVLSTFCSQASVSLQLAKLASDNAQRLREEQALSDLLRTISTAPGLDEMLSEATRVALDLLDAEAVVLRHRGSQRSRESVVRVGLSGEDAGRLLDELTSAIERASQQRAPLEVSSQGRSVLVVPVGGREETYGVVVMLRRSRHSWNERLARALASHLSLGFKKARLEDQERRQLQEYRQLAELGAELAHADDINALTSHLLAKMRDMFAGDVVWMATLNEGPDAIEITMLTGASAERFTIAMEGRGRVATLRLRDEPAPRRSVYGTWAQEVFAAVAGHSEAKTFVSEPMSVSRGVLGGLFVGWRDAGARAQANHERVMAVVANATGATIARLAAYQETDSTLRERVRDLEGLTQLAQRLTGLHDVDPITDEILSAFRRLGRLEGAMYAVGSGAQARVYRASGLSDERAAELLSMYERLRPEEGGGRAALASPGLEAIFLPAGAGAGGAFFAGVGPEERDPQRDRALVMIARYGAVALENADLHKRQRLAIKRLERRNEATTEQRVKLERILSVHENLAAAVLDGEGLASMSARVGEVIGGELTIVGSDQRILARWPRDAWVEWTPADPTALTRAITEPAGDGTHLILAPAVVEGDQWARVIARVPAAPDDVDVATVEYAALLTAFELLRERTATEIETRLRGGLLEELLGGDFVEELVSKRALALGLDLYQPSRVILIEAVLRGGEPQAPIDPERLVPAVAELGRAAGSGGFVALQGGSVVSVMQEIDESSGQGHPAPFEQRLRTVLNKRFPKLAVAVAAGTLCTTPGHYRRSFTAARRGLDLLRLQGRHDGVFGFRGKSIATLLLQSTEPDVMLEFVERLVEPLDRYDMKHSSELRRTAQTYYEAGGNLEDTARRLQIHVSTLRYRITRIADVTGINLRDPQAALDLQVALQAADSLTGRRTTIPGRGSTD